jgi:hypothetical protein
MADAYDFWADRVTREEARAIDTFWDRFERARRRIERSLAGAASHVDPDREVETALGELASRLFWDFELTEEGRRRLVVTAELGHSNRTLARAVVRRCPGIEGWAVADAREPIAKIPSAARSILFRSRSEAFAVEEITPRRAAHRMVDLDAAGRGDPEFLADQAGIVFSALLGDRADQDWLGESRARQVRRGGMRERLFGAPVPRNDRWLSDFRAACVEIISACEADRPEAPFAESRYADARHSDYRLKPAKIEAGRRRDAMIWQTRYPALAAARIAGMRIGAPRFTRFGESFCGVKLRRTQSAPFDRGEQLGRLAVAVEAALMEAKIGGLTGVGEGAHHVYLDVALMEIETALPLVRDVLKREKVEVPAWMIFDEAGLEDRYLPLTPGTPPTPLA